MTLPSRSVKKAGAFPLGTVIISIPAFSGELVDGLGRVTVSVGSGIEGSAPVAKVMSPPLTFVVLPEHCVCVRMWYVVDARMPATRIVTGWYFPGTGDQLVLLP